LVSLFTASLLSVLLLVSCSTNRTKLAYSDSAAPDWPTQRSNQNNTGALGSGITDEPYTVLWSTKTGGVAACEPVIRDGLVFFSGLDRRVEVFDFASGERKFRKRFDGPVLGVIPGDSTFGILVDQAERRYFIYDLRTAKEIKSFKVATVSCAPRMLSDTTVLMGTWHGRLLCYSLNGDPRWNAKCEGPIKQPPAVRDSVVYVASGRSVFALHAGDGEEIWQHGVSGAIEGGVAAEDHIYFGAADSFAAAIDPKNGDLVWSRRLDGGLFATPVVGDSFVYFAANDGSITALSKSDGALRWTHRAGAVANLSPTLCGDYLLSTSRQSTLTMLSAITGEQIWADTTLTAQATTSPVVVGDRILLTDSRRLLICLAPASQTQILSTPAE
jgi:outer membrane protein assembly factor BamB